MSTISSLTEFKPESEQIKAYLKHGQLLFDAKGIEDEKKVPVLLSYQQYYIHTVKQSFGSEKAT